MKRLQIVSRKSVKKQITRVMLVYPNQAWLKFDMTTTWNLSPYALCMLATSLEDSYKVLVVDAQFYNLTEEQFRARIEEFKPDCVGISLLTSEYAPVLDRAAWIVKDVDREILTVAGGVHVTTQYRRVFKNHNIDCCIRGEGERVFKQFLDYMNGAGDFPLKGMVYQNEKQEMVALPPDRIEDLDALPFPNYAHVDYQQYTNTKPRYGVDSLNVFPHSRILTSRGCPVGCCFCQVETISGGRWRARSAKNVFDEIMMLKERYGIRGFYIEDDNAFVQKSRIMKLLGLLKEYKLNLKWKAAGVPVFKMDEEIFELMAQTGCEMIGMAIESGSQRVLDDIIRKPVDLKKAVRLINSAKKRGIFVVVNFVIGFPGETWEEIRQTLRYAEECGADYCKIYAAQPLIGTKLFRMAKDVNCIEGDEESVDWRYGRITTSEFTPKDISILRAYEWDRINFSSPQKREKTAAIMGISVAELDKIRKKTRENLVF